MSIGNDMTLSNEIGCVWKRLDIYEQNIFSDQSKSSDSDGDHVVDGNKGGKVIMLYIMFVLIQNKYKHEFQNDPGIPLRHVKCRTDNAPSQY